MPMPDSSVPLKIGTRGSPLALAQADETCRLLMAAHGLDRDSFEIVVIKTTADRVQDRMLKDIGGKGLFTKEIEDALIAGDIDVAVHAQSMQRPGSVLATAPGQQRARSRAAGLRRHGRRGVPRRCRPAGACGA